MYKYFTEQRESANIPIEHVEEVNFIFFPDKLPSQRQLCYQLCDIKDQEGQELIHRNDGKETVCSVSLEGYYRIFQLSVITI